MKVKLSEADIPTREELIAIINSIENAQHKTLVTILYLTACRISEIVGVMKKRHWDFESHPSHVVVTATRLKIKKGVKKKKIPIPKADPLLDIVISYMENLSDNDALFPFNRIRAWKIIKRHMPDYWCHLMRHIRLTELVSVYDFNDHELQQIAGWSSTNPAKHYIHLKWKDLTKKLI